MKTLAPSRGIYLPSLAERYQLLIGARATERLLQKARRLKGLKVLHVNSTRQGGGVAEILSSMTPLMQSLGIEADWLVIDGPPEFFALTKDSQRPAGGSDPNSARGQAAAPSDGTCQRRNCRTRAL